MQIIKEYSMQNIKDGLIRVSDAGFDTVFWIVQPDKFVYQGSYDKGNVDKAVELGYQVHDLNMLGGCIVIEKGDLGFALVSDYPRSREIVSSSMSSFMDFLKSRGIDCEIDGNDVLIDGYKVAATTTGPTKYGKELVAMSISVHVDLEAIKAICTKPMVKTPKGLSEYGITTEEVEQWLKGWIEDNFLSKDRQ